MTEAERDRYYLIRRVINDAKFRVGLAITDFNATERRMIARGLMARGRFTEARQWRP